MQKEHNHMWSEKDQDTFRIRSDVKNMTDLFGRELTPELAKEYIGSLVAHIGPEYGSYEEFIKKGKEVHKTLGREVYGPLIVGFLEWVEHELSEKNVPPGPVHFALRDAWPFYAAAHVLWDGSHVYYPVGTYLNRPLLGIEDEIAPELTHTDGFVAEYLKKNNMSDAGKPVALVDSGAWGTVIRALKETYLPGTPLFPLFWYSHNPHIKGFINGLLAEVSLPPEFGEVLNDSMECVFPQGYRRPVAFETSGTTRTLSLIKSDALSVAWGQAALEGVIEAAHAYKNGISHEDVLRGIHKAYRLSQQSKLSGEWTGVLSTHTPTWSKGDEFLASWPTHLLP